MTRLQDYNVAQQETASLERLVAIYKDADYPFGRGLLIGLNKPHNTEITADLVKEYYASFEEFNSEDPENPGRFIVRPEMLHRALRTAQIQILLTKVSRTDRITAIKRQVDLVITNKLNEIDDSKLSSAGIEGKAEFAKEYTNTDAKIIQYLESKTVNVVDNYSIALTNDEVESLYHSIITALKQSTKPDTKAAVTFITTNIKPATATDSVTQVFDSLARRMMQPSLDKTQENYNKRNIEEPDRKLEEQDFLGRNVDYKEFLLKKVHLLAADHNDDFRKFNRIIRNLLKTSGSTPDEQKKLNYRIKFTLGKLATVLHKNGLAQDAHDIESHVFNSDSKFSDKLKKFKKEDMALPGTIDKIKSSVASVMSLINQTLRRTDIKDDLKSTVPLDLESKTNAFVAASHAYPESEVEASRKLLNKCRSLARKLNEIAIADATQKELDDKGATLSAGHELLNMFPRAASLKTLEHKATELMRKISVESPVASDAYLNTNNLQIARSNKMKALLAHTENELSAIEIQKSNVALTITRLRDIKTPEAVQALGSEEVKLISMNETTHTLERAKQLYQTATAATGQEQFDKIQEIEYCLEKVTASKNAPKP